MKKDITSLEELISDASFINWVKQTDPTDVQYWNEWIAQHPGKKKLVEDAALLVQGISFRKRQLPEREIAESWAALQTDIHRKSGKPIFLRERKYQLAAAVALLLSSIFAFWFISYEETVYYTTQYGEIRNIVLPDSSEVTLNANSTISFKPASLRSTERKVYLKGEAYFKVVKKPDLSPAKFMVITENAAVEVLGTQFNVNSRRGKTSVVLNNGKVKFNASEGQNAMLKPGDRVEYSSQQQALTLEKVDPELYSSWRQHKLKFDDTSLMELAQILEDNYGLKVIIENEQLQNKRITGEISAENVALILEAVSKLFKIKISRSDNIVYFS